jgi:hypothetical protein
MKPPASLAVLRSDPKLGSRKERPSDAADATAPKNVRQIFQSDLVADACLHAPQIFVEPAAPRKAFRTRQGYRKLISVSL